MMMRNTAFCLIGAVLLTGTGFAAYGADDQAWTEFPVSILESQIGYHPRNIKRVYLRSAQKEPPREFLPVDFAVIDAKTEKEAFRGKVKAWGRKWESYWWVLDFTPVRAPGEYYVQAGKLTSSAFTIEDGIFTKTDLGVIALDQLEHRIHQGLEDKRKGLAGKYVNCAQDVRIYMDCGSPYAELEPVGTCVYALMDLHNLLGDKFPEADRRRMVDLAALGADYFVAAQRHTDNPETDGMFYHSLLVNTNDTWASEIFTYLDTAYGVALTARAYQFFEKRDPARAARYLATAKRAWELCVRRPYHTKADRACPSNAYFWGTPPGIQDTFGRCLYNILDENWKMPDTLRTRDRLPFVQGSALLYEITGEPKYLDKAVEFADAVMERQFTDWQNPIEGCFGNFYEFAGNDQAFFHEFMQGGFWWEGNVEALNLDGFMRLLKVAPAHPRAAAWQNTLLTYADNYARRATTLNPLGIYPVACYRDKAHGGIKNFQNMLMGSSCLYGFSAKNFMALGDFLKDAGLQCHAIAGVNFIAGLNPGVPNVYDKDTAWDARTLILGVGRSWFGPTGEPAETAKGSVPNGFCASSQFWHMTGYTNYIALGPDRPSGIITPGGGFQFNEGWILHSHAYVQAVAHLEAGYTLRLLTQNQGAGVPARVSVTLREVAPPQAEIVRHYQTGSDGALTITDLPTPCAGTVRMAALGREILRPVAAIAGGSHLLAVDFAREVNLAIRVPERIAAGAKGEAVMVIENAGSENVVLKMILSAAGVTLEKYAVEVSLKSGEKKRAVLTFKCGDKVMPYLVRAVIVEGAPSREFYATGKIGRGR
ncbi:MAG: glycoside hydrolase family 9 protein [bacterium]